MKNPKLPKQCIVISWVIGVTAYLIAIKYGPLIFSRSGSLMVLFGVMAEYSLLQGRFTYLNDRLKNYGGFDAGHIGETEPEERHKKLELIAHTTVAIGTFIWGFGDCFINA